MEPLFFLVVAGVVGAVIAAACKSRADALNRSWSRAAGELGVSLRPGTWTASPQLEGTVSGYPLTIDIEKRRAGKHRTAYTRFTLGVPRLPAGARLKREGFLSGISKAFGVKDIEIGDPAFDSQVHVKADDAETMREFLTPARRRNLIRFLEAHSGAVVERGGISWSSRGRMRDSTRVLDTVEEMLSLARVLAGDETGQSARDASRADPKVVAAVTEGDEAEWEALAAATGVPAAAWATSAAMHESESAAASANEPMPTAASAQASEPVSAVETLSELEPKGQPASEPAGQRALDAPEADSDPGAAAAFCAAVFAPGTMSFETTRTFDSDYKGKRVSWTGTLKSAEPYRFDFVFGAGPAVKATLVLRMTGGAGTVGNGEVKAVISLPEIDGLDSRIGERVDFAGTLHKVDGFSRSVFLTEAALV